MCCDTEGRVVVTPKDGEPVSLDEPYVFENDTSGVRYFCEAVIDRPPGRHRARRRARRVRRGSSCPKGRLWVMGDHRADSADSRYHVNDPNQGTVPVSKVIGRAAAVVYPLGHWGTLRVPEDLRPRRPACDAGAARPDRRAPGDPAPPPAPAAPLAGKRRGARPWPAR